MQIEKDDDIPYNGENKSKKTITLIVILIAITLLAVIGIILAIMSLSNDKLAVTVDGRGINYTEDTFIFTEDGKIYISIRDIAPFVGYEAHNGEYKVDVEDNSKIYVENKNETASFYLNSKIVSKVAPNTTNDYDNLTISEPVVSINGKLYVISDGFSIGFNSSFFYNKETNRITIQTLPYLIDTYNNKIANYGYSKISDDFDNQKALIYGMIVASKESTGKYGVIDSSNGNEIISPRYNKIQFVESSGEFIITNSSEKVGIAYNTGKTKITVSYDDIKVIDSKLGLYLVKSNNKYGIINSIENFIAHIEYDQIGVNISNFPFDNISNPYILYDYIIPAKINNKWVLLNTSGERITNDEYDEVGFINTKLKDRVVNSCLTIGDTKTIIVGNDEKYGGIDVKGNDLIQVRYDAVYSKTRDGETTYYILFNGVEYNAVELINLMKKSYGYEEETVVEETNINNVNTNEDNNTIILDITE